MRGCYTAELKRQKEMLTVLHALLKEHAVVTLLFSSKEEKLNNAVVLKAYLRKQPGDRVRKLPEPSIKRS